MLSAIKKISDGVFNVFNDPKKSIMICGLSIGYATVVSLMAYRAVKDRDLYLDYITNELFDQAVEHSYHKGYCDGLIDFGKGKKNNE